LQHFHPFDRFADRTHDYPEKIEMSAQHTTKIHEHVAKRVHVLLQRAGIPYEFEQQVCADCARVLDEKPVKRAAA